MRRQITPTARGQLSWIAETYGIGQELLEWSREITRGARSKKRPLLELPLIDTLKDLEELAGMSGDDWALTRDRFLQGGYGIKLRLLIAAVLNRRPPHRLRVNRRTLYAFSDKRLGVEIKIAYEIDLTNGVVVFRSFQHFSASMQETEAQSNIAENW